MVPGKSRILFLNINSRGKWYTDLKARKIELAVENSGEINDINKSDINLDYEVA